MPVAELAASLWEKSYTVAWKGACCIAISRLPVAVQMPRLEELTTRLPLQWLELLVLLLPCKEH